MKRKWPWLFGGAVVAVVLELADVLPKDARDFAWGLSIGLAIGAAFHGSPSVASELVLSLVVFTCRLTTRYSR